MPLVTYFGFRIDFGVASSLNMSNLRNIHKMKDYGFLGLPEATKTCYPLQ